MKQHELYARLELVAPDLQPAETVQSLRAVSTWKFLAARLSRAGHSLLHYFCGSMEPRVAIRRSGDGVTAYRLYDPWTQEHRVFCSETELRVWLEQRYYQ